MEPNNVFQRVSYSKKDIERDAAEETLADGAIVKIVIDKVEYKTAPTKGKGPGEDLIQVAQVSVLDPRDEQTRLKRHRIWIRNVLPLINPDFEDTHIPPEYAKGLWSQFVQAFIPERHFQAPQRKDGQVFYQGKKMDAAKVQSIELERSDARLKEAEELSKSGGTALLRCMAYATLKKSGGDDGSVFVNANNLRAELKEGESLTPYENLVVKALPGQSEEQTQAQAVAPTNGKTVATKTATPSSRARRRS